jgi:thiamine-monophosphate kinase
MDERAALALVGESVPAAGDDAAVVDDLVITTDMLHERADLPDGVTAYTAGWRAVGVSLSDVAATGARAVAAVAAYGAPTFETEKLRSFLRGATDVCAAVDAEYVGGDLDSHEEFTVASTAVGRLDDERTNAPLGRDGATPGDRVYVTGTLGRTAAALRLFGLDPAGDAGGESDAPTGGHTRDRERANELFRFTPRVAAGRAIAAHATAALDVSDGLARSAHLLAAASDCGVALDGDRLPVDPAVDRVARDPTDRRELSTFVGEDFELLFTVPERDGDSVATSVEVPVTEVGRVTETGVTLDGDPLPDRGYTHGGE